MKREVVRAPISAKFLLADAAPGKRDAVAIPAGFVIQKLTPRAAHGSRRPMSGGSGGGAATTQDVAASGDRRALLNYAARNARR